jgi:putative lipoic acid-binding regulatory protein
MATTDLIEKDLEKQIIATQKRFQKAMQTRLAYMTLSSKERYFAVLSLLVTKLEEVEKPLRDVLQDVLVESAPFIAQELSDQ